MSVLQDVTIYWLLLWMQDIAATADSTYIKRHFCASGTRSDEQTWPWLSVQACACGGVRVTFSRHMCYEFLLEKSGSWYGELQLTFSHPMLACRRLASSTKSSWHFSKLRSMDQTA
jgi:hypothetical protein